MITITIITITAMSIMDTAMKAMTTRCTSRCCPEATIATSGPRN